MRKLVRDTKGSLTLEATIVFPVFLAILLLLINLVNIAMIYLAMDHAVHETVKQIALRAYPLDYLRSATGINSSPNQLEEYISRTGLLGPVPGQSTGDPEQSTGGPEQLAGAGVLSELIKSDLINLIGSKIKSEVTETAVNTLVVNIISARIKELYPLNNIAARDIKVDLVNMYNPNHVNKEKAGMTADWSDTETKWNSKDIAVRVEYKVKPLVPFLPPPEIILSNTAAERAWVDG